MARMRHSLYRQGVKTPSNLIWRAAFAVAMPGSPTLALSRSEAQA
jgi:hypothetical protein